MVHKPKHKVHSFRGLLADGGQDEINLERSNVNLAYRIVKFETILRIPASQHASVIQIFREEQTTVPTSGGFIDFNDTDLLAASLFISGNLASETYYQSVIFDNTLFSRNIYVTHTENDGGDYSMNYYLEIEEVPVGAATLMQLKLGSARKLIGGSMGK